MIRVLGSSLLCAAGVIAQTNFPAPPAPALNPPSPQKELLGMALFFEEQLSSTSTVACATCHDLARGGIDPRTAHGVNPGPDQVFGTPDDQNGSHGIGQLNASGAAQAHPVHGFGAAVTGRRALTVINSGYHTALGYEGNRNNLEDLAAVPILNSVEMSHPGRTWTQVAQKLAGSTPLVFASNLPARLSNFVNGRTYAELFQAAFGSPTITQQTITRAIAAYVRTLNSDQSKWDLHLHGLATLTAQEQLGLSLFNTPAAGATACSTCHGDFEGRVLQEGPIVGQMTTVTSGYYGSPVSTRLLFHNVGIRPIAEDPGRQQTTSIPGDAGKFRVASLRNVDLMAPYFHNGRAQTLGDVIEFYNRGGDFHVNQAPSLTQRNYTVVEKDAIVALLQTLTDPRVAAGVYPFDKPTLGSENGRLVTSSGQGHVTQTGQMVASAPVAPRLGEQWFQLTLSGATPGAFTFLLWDTQLGGAGQPFGVQLGLTPAFQAFLVGPAVQSSTMQSGVVVAPLPLPNVPALSGQTLFTQWLSVEGNPQSPLSTSNALRIPLL
jgi:cytochrome c peroxidase